MLRHINFSGVLYRKGEEPESFKLELQEILTTLKQGHAYTLPLQLYNNYKDEFDELSVKVFHHFEDDFNKNIITVVSNA